MFRLSKYNISLLATEGQFSACMSFTQSFGIYGLTGPRRVAQMCRCITQLLQLVLTNHHACSGMHVTALFVIPKNLQCASHLARSDKLQSANLVDSEGLLTIWQEASHLAAQGLSNRVFRRQAGVDIEGARHSERHSVQLLVYQHPGLRLCTRCGQAGLANPKP